MTSRFLRWVNPCDVLSITICFAVVVALLVVQRSSDSPIVELEINQRKDHATTELSIND